MDRQVEKENGRSRSSKGRAACSGRTPEVRTDGSKRERGRSVSATSVGGTTSEQANKRRRGGKRNLQRKYQQTQKRFQHKCRAHKSRKKDGAKGEKEIKLIKGMGTSGMQPSKGNAVAQSNSACHRVAESNSQQTGLISPQAKPQVSSAYYRQDSRSTLPKPQV